MHMTIEPLRAETFRSQVENRLREAITSGRLRAGEKLVERELCESLGISRPLLREALRKLEAEKLIVLIPHRGPEVATIDANEAREIYAVRRVLETLTVQEFTRRASDEDVARLAQAVARLMAAGKKKSREGVLQAKAEFYAILLAGAGNKLVQEMLGGLLSRVSLLRGTSLMSPERLPRSLEEIGAMLDCIRKRDARGAAQVAEKHVLNAERAALEVLVHQQAAIPPIVTKESTKR
jgi:DNA-binding GntR family transcriptional regulator